MDLCRVFDIVSHKEEGNWMVPEIGGDYGLNFHVT